MIKINEVVDKLDNVKSYGDQYTARCPAHEDMQNSLAITTGDNGCVLLHCFAGCEYEKIITALGFSAADFKEKRVNKSKKVVATYDYEDENGKVLYQVVRTDPKGFFQRRQNGQGGWTNGLKDVKRVLYNLPSVLYGVRESKPIIFVEGEKDAQNLIRIGFIATTSAMGAGSWKNEYASCLAGADVVILPDNDISGHKYAKMVAESIIEYGGRVKLLELPDLEEKEDVSDWLKKGGTREELEKLIKSAPNYEVTEIKLSQNERVIRTGYPLTDLGNAERLVSKFGNDIRYCFESKQWLFWSGIRWEWDKSGNVERKAKEVVRTIYGEAEFAESNEERRQIAQWAMASESKSAIRSMIDLAKTETGVPISRKEFDKNDWLINCLNGTIDLKTGILLEHIREDFITFLAPVQYDSYAKSQIFTDFINRILPQKELREFVQVSAGYSMTGNTSEEKLFFAYGPAATGKSTLFSAIKSALGDYAATTDFETFLERKGASGGPRNDVARLAGKRFVLGSEVDEGKKMAESLIKQITGNDEICARFLHQEHFEFQPKMKLWMAANFRPKVNSQDAAMWRRILQIPFIVHIPKEERDPKIKQFLNNPEKGGPVILSYLVQGCLKWQKDGLIVPQIIDDFTNEYREEMDPLKEFFADCCIVNPLAKVSNTQLWSEYENWCRENGEKYPLGRKKFTQNLESRGYIQSRSSTSRFWTGLGMKSYKEIIDDESNNSKLIKGILF